MRHSSKFCLHCRQISMIYNTLNSISHVLSSQLNSHNCYYHHHHHYCCYHLCRYYTAAVLFKNNLINEQAMVIRCQFGCYLPTDSMWLQSESQHMKMHFWIIIGKHPRACKTLWRIKVWLRMSGGIKVFYKAMW